MKLSYRLLTAAALIAVLSAIVLSCQKETSFAGDGAIPPGQAKLSIYLTDGPYDFQQVLVDIQRIEVKIDTCLRNDDDDDHGNHHGCNDDRDSLQSRCEIWDTLDIRAGVYDLLSLCNGVDTLLASGFVINGKIQRIKFTLGTSNSVMVDSVVYPLQLLNNQNFIFVNIKREHFDSLTNNNLQLYLDFDVARSIKYRNGEYWLRPVLKPFGRHSTGEIEGKIRPVHSWGTLYAFNTTDTFYARPDHHEGKFKIRGLREGTYSLFIDGVNGYQDSTITGIVVRRSRDTELGTIQLHQ